MLTSRPLILWSLFRSFRLRIILTWVITLVETALLALIPLFIGFAIDGLLAGDDDAFWLLSTLMILLVVVAVGRRIYDTRIYGTIRVAFGKAQFLRAADVPVSKLNARIGMGRELVDFFEDTLPVALTGAVQLVVSLCILFAFSPDLALSAGLAGFGMVAIYALFHRRFYALNAALNHQTEQQVGLLERRSLHRILAHFLRLRRAEVRLSDAEAVLYDLIFALLLGMILFNLKSATGLPDVTAGMIFAVVSYSWEFVDSAIALPATLQSWTRLSEITARINQT